MSCRQIVLFLVLVYRFFVCSIAAFVEGLCLRELVGTIVFAATNNRRLFPHTIETFCQGIYKPHVFFSFPSLSPLAFYNSSSGSSHPAASIDSVSCIAKYVLSFYYSSGCTFTPSIFLGYVLCRFLVFVEAWSMVSLTAELPCFWKWFFLSHSNHFRRFLVFL